jgi:hypothetical protein
MSKCPGGHTLPNKTKAGRCTALYCAVGFESKGGRKAKGEVPLKKKRPIGTQAQKFRDIKQAAVESIEKAAVTAHSDVEAVIPKLGGDHEETIRSNAAIGHAESLAKLGDGAGRFAARAAFMEMPKGLKGQDAIDWTAKAIEDVQPEAFAEMKYQLRYGDASQRERAARFFLESGGFGKKEQAPAAAQPIVIKVTGGGTANVSLPWDKPDEFKVVNGEVVHAAALPARAGGVESGGAGQRSADADAVPAAQQPAVGGVQPLQSAPVDVDLGGDEQ